MNQPTSICAMCGSACMARGMAHIVCERCGQALSLFVVPGRSDREQVLEIVGHEALVWTQDETTFVLVADQGPVKLGLVADYVRQYTD